MACVQAAVKRVSTDGLSSNDFGLQNSGIPEKNVLKKLSALVQPIRQNLSSSVFNTGNYVCEVMLNYLHRLSESMVT